jgi:acyl transferase domain-containing protein/phosphopantetheinyl transferase
MSRQQEIAIIGMSCMFPEARDMRAYWHNILNKVYAVGEPPDSWGADRYYDPSSNASDKIYTKAGGFLGDLYRFDPTEFGIMPSSVDGQEPDQFLALKLARDALADAGYARAGFDHTNTGIVLGHSTYLHRAQGSMVQHGVVLDQTVELFRQLYPDIPAAALARIREMLKAKLPPFNSDVAPGVVPNVMTGRIANRLDFKGPNYLIDAACASSLLAVQAGIEELRNRRSDLMLAGGVNASSPAEAFMVFTHLGGLSHKSRIRPFDSHADGTLLGEGLGVVVLKRLEDAERDNDRVYAVVKSVGQSSDGRGLGLLAPRLEGEVLAMERAYRQAGIDPRSVTLMEAHGTGIPLGDKTEIQALRQVMGGRDGRVPRCAMGSVKSMISHCIPAAGVAGLIKTSLALYHRVLPPTLCEQPNPALGIEETPLYLNTATRPWIHREDQPRRAGVNAFGFGGINTHAIVEEYTGAEPAQAAVVDWESELCLIAAADRADLMGQIRAVTEFVEHAPEDVTLKDIAYTLACRCGSGRQRLAVVATGRTDLLQKMRRAEGMLSDAGRHRLKTRSGSYFSDAPLDGGVAFLFPGEGAQYQRMLADLAIYFPVVRKWFDFWDSIFADERDDAPSAAVFPPPSCINEAMRKGLEERLYSLELGSESMFIATQAVFALLGELGLKPNAVVGHSSGENSALVASGLVSYGDATGLRGHIRRLNQMYKEMESAGDIVTGALLTVGAVDRDDVLKLLEEFDGRLHLALDNCHHQSVLFGPKDLMENAAQRLRALGGLCSYLPFDRAYHTPLFEPVAAAIERFYEDVAFAAPQVPVYSCLTAGLFPADAQEARSAAARQWSSRVRFTETVERMYDDGVRYFIEVGPSGNLTAFVEDILKGRQFVAASANNRNRKGLLQLQYLLGQMFAHGREFTADALFRGRGTRHLDFNRPAEQGRRPAPPLSNTLPYIRLSQAELTELRAMVRGSDGAPAQGRDNGAAVLPDGVTGDRVDSAVSPDAPAAMEQLMAGYFGMMQDFLARQARVIAASLGAPATATEQRPRWPFIQRLLEQDGDDVTAEFDLDVARHPFLQQHILYASRVSDLDPDLHSLPVVPLTVSLEMLAETAGVAAGLPVLQAMENVRAYNWIALDGGCKTLRMVARRLPGNAGEERFHAAIYDGEAVLLEGDVIFTAAVTSSAARLAELAAPRAPVWQDHELYTSGMFHGPMYHSVKHLVAWDDTGIDAQLTATPYSDFFGDGSTPVFYINPVLMDAVGHLTAFWIAETRGTDFSCFPSSIRRIELARPDAADTEGCLLRGRIAFLDDGHGSNRFLEGAYECVTPENELLFRIEGWRDRFFSVPHSFYYGRVHPRDGWYGEDWSGLFPALADDTLIWHLPRFPDGFLEDAGAVWKRLLALTVLSREERLTWEQLPPNGKRRSEWLMGRIALKEAARAWIHRHSGVLLYPADVVIRPDPAGKPWVAHEELEGLPVPQVSLTHAGGYTVAAAGPPEWPLGIDLEAYGRIAVDDFIVGAFSDGERALFQGLHGADREGTVLRLWCAKEAAAKCLGVGLNGRPREFEVRELTSAGDYAVVQFQGEAVPVAIQAWDRIVIGLATHRIMQKLHAFS